MHKLEQLIAEWRETMATAPGVGRETLDELESHLRESIDQLVRSGMTETEAFRSAVAQLGSPPTIAAEFKKLSQSTWWPVKVAIGMVFAVTIALAAFLAMHFDDRSSRLLLVSHVFTVTLGYVTTFLIGALGICFVCQRCFSEFSPPHLQSLRRASFLFTSFAAGMTAAGIVLAAFWAKAEWGRYWDWDPKETGGLCVLLWLVVLMAAHGWRRTTARGVAVLSIVGNVIVSLAWFGANLVGGLHGYGTPTYWLLAVLTISHLAFFLAAFAPAGCLRLRKA